MMMIGAAKPANGAVLVFRQGVGTRGCCELPYLLLEASMRVIQAMVFLSGAHLSLTVVAMNSITTL
jgi:hypothetical protein